MEEDNLYPPLEPLSKDFIHFWENLDDDYRERMEEDDLYPRIVTISLR